MLKPINEMLKPINEMLKPIFFSIICLGSQLFSPSLLAALPPYYQSAKEIIAILNSSIVAQKLSTPYPIDSIKKTEKGYRLAAGKCELEVNIIYKPREDGLVGPVNFEIIPGERSCH